MNSSPSATSPETDEAATQTVKLLTHLTRPGVHSLTTRARVKDVHLLSWFLTGALAGLDGAIIPLWIYTGLGYSDTFLVLVISGSSLVASTVLPELWWGVLESNSQKAHGTLSIVLFGIRAADYESLYLMIFIVVILMLEPQGIMGFFENPHHAIKTLQMTMARIRNYFAKRFHAT